MRVASSREGDNSNKPELVQSTTRGTNAYGNSVPVPSSKESIASPGEHDEDAGSSSAESVLIKSASSSDVYFSEEEEGGNRQGPREENIS